MSSGWGIRCDGGPYFGFVQRDLTNMITGRLGSGGDFSMTLDLILHGAPSRFSADDEEHALFSYFNFPAAGATADLLTIGVTPSGRIYGRGPSTNKLQTQPGLLTWDNKERRITFNYTSAGTMSIELDDIVAITGSGAGGGCEPTTGLLGRVALFTGATGLTRVPCTILSAVFGDENAGLIYDIEEGAGDLTAGVAPDYTDNDFTLGAQYWHPPFSGSVWGADPSAPVSHGYKWKFRNDWQRVVRTPNRWARL